MTKTKKKFLELLLFRTGPVSAESLSFNLTTLKVPQKAETNLRLQNFKKFLFKLYDIEKPGHVAQSVGHLTRKSGVLGSIPGLATYFGFSFRFFKKGSCQLLEKVCARSTG